MKCSHQEEISVVLNRQEVESISNLYKVLGEKNRLGIVYMLNQKEMCVHELTKRLEVSQSLVSHQLKILRDSKVVKTKRRGNEIVYSLVDEHIVKLLEIVKEHLSEE